MFTLMCEYPKPQFIMHFEPEDFHNFYKVRDWLVSQTLYTGWSFKTREWQQTGKTNNHLLTALKIHDGNLAVQAKLMFPDELMSYSEWEDKVKNSFFIRELFYRRIDNNNYDVIPKNDPNH
jgi:hypothetical protein